MKREKKGISAGGMNMLAFAAMAAMPAMACAADGEITFKGEITAQTCSVRGNGQGKNFEVKLPTIPAAQLDAAGKEAGYTPFTISLNNCAEDSGKVYTFFEAGPSVDPDTGHLKPEGAEGAKGVQVAIMNSDFSTIKVGAEPGAQNSASVSINEKAAELNYYAKYIAIGKAEAGAVSTTVRYSIAYE
ncbi:fimbrial protein [Burkholderia semiarida]|uniref:Fimbrial protein n=1 Tax=Burkholderia semiarida TaxID=2843303 RepID=A0ABW7L9J2_9BURK